MIKSLKIKALTSTGLKGVNKIKQEYGKAVVRWSLKKLKISISFSDDTVTIINPAFQFCDNLDNEKAVQGLTEIKESFKALGAEEGKDYIIEVVK